LYDVCVLYIFVIVIDVSCRYYVLYTLILYNRLPRTYDIYSIGNKTFVLLKLLRLLLLKIPAVYNESDPFVH